jgi:hypothetical protein
MIWCELHPTMSAARKAKVRKSDKLRFMGAL